MLASERVENLRALYAISRRKLRQDRGFAASNLVAICELERRLANDLLRRGKYAESRALLMDSLELAGRAKSVMLTTRMSTRRMHGL